MGPGGGTNQIPKIHERASAEVRCPPPMSRINWASTVAPWWGVAPVHNSRFAPLYLSYRSQEVVIAKEAPLFSKSSHHNI